MILQMLLCELGNKGALNTIFKKRKTMYGFLESTYCSLTSVDNDLTWTGPCFWNLDSTQLDLDLSYGAFTAHLV